MTTVGEVETATFGNKGSSVQIRPSRQAEGFRRSQACGGPLFGSAQFVEVEHAARVDELALTVRWEPSGADAADVYTQVGALGAPAAGTYGITCTTGDAPGTAFAVTRAPGAGVSLAALVGKVSRWCSGRRSWSSRCCAGPPVRRAGGR
ncbi:hypothetical protein Val02_72110 [Virgisporangium aliadipatigenens]|uniref:Uncharacterized protein n=1 Tax=Virgisporangium aliadipatigenens TaxID=741659 RepID=A0A8J3YUZ5_9ACTN|nr:hypothetical protein Val02_72110 [Virgisporangium aliadipatigenens]